MVRVLEGGVSWWVEGGEGGGDGGGQTESRGRRGRGAWLVGGEGRVGEGFVGGVEVGKVGRVAVEGQPYGEVE